MDYCVYAMFTLRTSKMEPCLLAETDYETLNPYKCGQEMVVESKNRVDRCRNAHGIADPCATNRGGELVAVHDAASANHGLWFHTR